MTTKHIFVEQGSRNEPPNGKISEHPAELILELALRCQRHLNCLRGEISSHII